MPCFRGSLFKEKFFRVHPHHPHQNLPKRPNIKGWRPVEGAPNPHHASIPLYIGVSEDLGEGGLKKKNFRKYVN